MESDLVKKYAAAREQGVHRAPRNSNIMKTRTAYIILFDLPASLVPSFLLTSEAL
jgi:hypothetical protein